MTPLNPFLSQVNPSHICLQLGIPHGLFFPTKFCKDFRPSHVTFTLLFDWFGSQFV
jgi:hypothetical protein